MKFEILQTLSEKSRENIHISGVSEGRAMPLVSIMLKEKRTQCLIITADESKARSLSKDLAFFSDAKIYVLPEEEQLLVTYDAKSHGDLNERLAAQKALLSGERCVIIAPATAAVKRIAPHTSFADQSLTISVGERCELEELKGRLVSMGYERAVYVEAKGQYSIRGGIVDIYAADMDNPVRLDFFGDELDSIRSFEIESQRSIENMNTLDIFPAEQMVQDREVFKKAMDKILFEYDAYSKRAEGERKEKILERKEHLLDHIEHLTNVQLLENYMHYFYETPEFIWDYMQEQGVIVFDEPDRIKETLNFRETELKNDFEHLLEKGYLIPYDFQICNKLEDLQQAFGKRMTVFFTSFSKKLTEYGKIHKEITIQSKQAPVYNGKMDFLETDLKRFAKSDYQITLVCSTSDRVENMKSFIDHCGLMGKVTLVQGSLSSGMEFPEEKLLYLWDGEIFTFQKQRKTKKESKNAKPIKVFTDIRKGDYVVHENHGIGKFIGIEQLTVQNIKKDYLKIKYAGEDMLYIPIDQMDLIQKFIGSDEAAPKISKLSGGEWKKTKARAKAAIANMAKELIELSAARQIQEGYAFGPDTAWQRDFEEIFPYEETHDQLRCIQEIKADMEKAICMDRLLCGDVGYGKTEVAARAIFKCAAEGKQAVVLVPTTVLANQHYYTFKKRFEDFPFSVEMLCRFRTEKQQEAIIDKLKQGSIDIIVGTHRLLSKDITFHNLGLLVIDEEQRFGVQHKERMKTLKKNVDVLTLSATPIPRTLHMSLVGIKEMSLIEEPPEERYPVQTYVMEQDESLISEAIKREMGRGGQVFVVYNRVRGINRIAAQIEDLVPEARVAVGHGQMSERALEDVMISFVEHEYDVLVATTIIESGLDISNANTMIIIDSDKYGLSQLYQLRGRVGRSNRMAYAYLMYQKDKTLSQVAEKRLRAIREFTEFGAGFRIAMRDLEIRGAGNLLGTEQHGHMMTIGYELYCKLIEEAVKELKGEVVSSGSEEINMDIDVPAYIPKKYIGDEILKLQMYKKIAAIKKQDDLEDLLDEFLDRFGEVPIETLNLMKVSLVRSLAERVGIISIGSSGGKIVYEFGEKNSLRPEVVAKLVEAYGMKVLIHGGLKPNIRCIPNSKNKLEEILGFLKLFMLQ